MQSTGKEGQKVEGPGATTETYEEQDDTILLRTARVAYGAAVRWKREIRIKENHEMQTVSMGNDKDGKIQYCSRLLSFTRCGTEQETKEKQMKVEAGFRAINCKKCGTQERVHSNMCRCNVNWHH